MVDFAGIGSMLSGIGSIGSMFGGGKTSQKYIRKTLRSQQMVFRDQLPLNLQAVKEAGIHPLVYMGAGGYQHGAVSVGDQGNDWAAGLESLGQNVSRAAGAFMSGDERKKAAAADALGLERMKLENELLRSQITSVNRATNPALPNALSAPVDGQGDSRGVTTNPLDVTASRSNNPSQEAGAINEVGWMRTENGYAPVMSNDAKQRLEDDLIGELSWHARNRLSPPPIPFKAPDGKVWQYDVLTGQFYARRRTIFD